MDLVEPIRGCLGIETEQRERTYSSSALHGRGLLPFCSHCNQDTRKQQHWTDWLPTLMHTNFRRLQSLGEPNRWLRIQVPRYDKLGLPHPHYRRRFQLDLHRERRRGACPKTFLVNDVYWPLGD